MKIHFLNPVEKEKKKIKKNYYSHSFKGTS